MSPLNFLFDNGNLRKISLCEKEIIQRILTSIPSLSP